MNLREKSKGVTRKIRKQTGKNLFVMFLFMFVVNSAYGADLKFDQALKKLKNTNRAIQAARMEKEQRRYEKKAAFGLYFPKVDVLATYSHLKDDIVMDLGPVRDAIALSHFYANFDGTNLAEAKAKADGINAGLASQSDFKEVLQDKDMFFVTAAVIWPVFTGGKIIAANRAAEARLRGAREKLRYTEYKVTTELAQRYFALCLAKEVVKVRKEVLNGMNEHLDQASKLEKNGMIARTEKLHAEVSHSEADRKFKSSTRDAAMANTALCNTLSSDEKINPLSSLFLVRKVEDLSYFKKKALLMNPLLKQVSANRELAHQGHMKELAEYSPEIFLMGTVNLYTKNLSSAVPDWTVGAGAKMKIFDGFSRYNKLKASKEVEGRVKCLEKKAKHDIGTLVEKCYQELMKDLEQIEALETSLKFAEEYLRVRQKAFKEGFATSIDVVDARLVLTKAKIERLQVVYKFDISLARLLEASGMSEQYEKYRNRKDVEVGF